MAGTPAKVMGSIAIVIGALLLIGGVSSAAYAFSNEESNRQQVVSDQGRSNENSSLLAAGAAAGGIGIFLLIIGIVAVIIGAGKSKHAAAVLLAGQGTAPQRLNKSATNAKPSAPSAKPMTTKGVLMAFGAVIAVLVAAMIIMALFTSKSGGLFGSQDNPELLREDEGSGVLRGSAGSVLLDPQPQNIVEFDLHPETSRVWAGIGWNETQGGAASLRMQVDINVDGAWTTLDSQEGTSPLVVEYSEPGLAGAKLRVVVSSPDVVLSQSFEVVVESWSR